MATSYKTRKSGAFSWYFQRISGTLLLLLLFTHFWIEHFSPHTLSTDAGGFHLITYAKVMERLQNPLWKVFNLGFLYLGTYHGIQGLINVGSDYIQKPQARSLMVVVLVLAGSALAIWGTYVMVTAGIIVESSGAIKTATGAIQ